MKVKGSWSELPYYSQFLILVGIVFVCTGIFTFLSLLCLKPLFGLDLLGNPALLQDYTDPIVINAQKFLQIFNSISAFVLPPIIFAFLVSFRPDQYLGISRKPSLQGFLFVFLAILAAQPLVNWMGYLNESMSLPPALQGLEKIIKELEETAAKLTAAFLDVKTVPEFIVTFIMIAVIPAIGEELLFRGCIQRLFTSWMKNAHIAIFFTAIIFSALHMQFYGFLPRMVLGMYLGYLYWWTGNLWIPILAHLTNNGAAVILSFLFQKHLIGFDPDHIGKDNSALPLVFISFMIFTAMTFLLYKRERKLIASPSE